MEKYKYQNEPDNEQPLNLGKYFSRINNKHIKAYGEVGASNIVDNIRDTYVAIQKQLLDNGKNNNALLVGKVQSGKTSNLELLTALAFDNGYNILVIYGGYDNTLLSQTTTRFKTTFDVPEQISYSDDSPAIFSTDDSAQILNIDDEIICDLLECKKPIIFVSMKRPAAMLKINSLLKRVDKSKFKAFIIDDEGDQASLNTAKNKKKDASATYKAICEMKTLLSDPMYLSVTATPQANIFLDEYSQLRPDSIRLIQPGIGYCGAEAYHLYDSNIIEIISTDDHEMLEKGRMPISIRNAINYFIIASAIMKSRGIEYSDMIIHSYREVDQHSFIYNCVESYIDDFKEDIRNDDPCLQQRLEELDKCFNQYFNMDVKSEYSFQSLTSNILIVVKKLYVILKNGVGKATQTNEGLRKHKIYIGGDLLQRGLTFPNLVNVYFTRWANNSGNMDTNLQRARWFGYRQKYIDICKIFTTANIAQEFTALAEIEADLWEQFAEVETGNLKIDDILIQSENTKQSPTRKSAASFKKVSFKHRWIKQKSVIFDKLQVKENNNLIQEILSSMEFHETTAGRTDGKTSARYTILDSQRIRQLIDHIHAVFEYEPFERQALINLVGQDNIPIILMHGFDNEGRKRSLYPGTNNIKALLQGADNKDKSKIVYEGDSGVIINKNSINIQIHKIIPVRKNGNSELEQTEFTQYMFAIYLPKEKIYFVKG